MCRMEISVEVNDKKSKGQPLRLPLDVDLIHTGGGVSVTFPQNLPTAPCSILRHAKLNPEGFISRLSSCAKPWMEK